MPSLEFVDLPAELSPVCGLLIRVRGNPSSALHPSHQVLVEVMPVADNEPVYDEDGEIAMIRRTTDRHQGFTVAIESTELAPGYRYLVCATSSGGVSAAPAPVRKLGHKPACFQFGQAPALAPDAVGAAALAPYDFPRLVFDSLPAAQVPHNADLPLPGTISVYRAGMHVFCKRWLMTNGVTSDEQNVGIVIDGPTVDGQPSTFLATVLDAQLDPNKTYFVKATVDVSCQPGTILVSTVS